jgi:hypothetical protein
MMEGRKRRGGGGEKKKQKICSFYKFNNVAILKVL